VLLDRPEGKEQPPSCPHGLGELVTREVRYSKALL
jgi:hypothetical protein